MSEQAQDQQQNNAKVEKQFNNVMNKLKAVVGGEDIALPTTVAKDDMSDIVQELFADESKAVREEVKTGLRDVLKKHVLMTKEIAKKKQELAALELSKKKEFIKASNELFNKVDNIDTLQREYVQSLSEAIAENPEDSEATE